MSGDGGKWWNPDTREAVAFFFGLAIGAFEVLIRDDVRPIVFAFALTLCGYPVAMVAAAFGDRIRNGHGGGQE